MKKDELRKVKYRPFDTVTERRKGYFHLWGNSTTYTESGGTMPVTVAIIEDENGKIHAVEPYLVEFVDD